MLLWSWEAHVPEAWFMFYFKGQSLKKDFRHFERWSAFLVQMLNPNDSLAVSVVSLPLPFLSPSNILLLFVLYRQYLASFVITSTVSLWRIQVRCNFIGLTCKAWCIQSRVGSHGSYLGFSFLWIIIHINGIHNQFIKLPVLGQVWFFSQWLSFWFHVIFKMTWGACV